MLGKNLLLSRRILQNFARNHHGGTPGENLPFSLGNPYKLTALFIAFFGSGLAVPYVVVRYQLTKN